MRKALLVALSLFLSLTLSITAFAQEDTAKTKTIKPILLSKDALSGIGLKKIELKNEPIREFYQKRLYGGKEISVYVVSSESWIIPFDSFWFDEFIYILNGKSNVKHKEGVASFESQEFVFAPKGFPGEWEVDAGSNLHYELSVITNKRADSTEVSLYHKPQLLDKAILSGTEIELNELGLYENVLIDGIELTIKLKAEAPREQELATGEKEKLICLLSGKLVLADSTGEKQTFYAGDYIVIPHNFVGHWESYGHGIVKYITVQES